MSCWQALLVYRSTTICRDVGAEVLNCRGLASDVGACLAQTAGGQIPARLPPRFHLASRRPTLNMPRSASLRLAVRLAALLLLFPLSPSSSVAAGSWPVEPGPRETVTLTALRSLPEAIYDSIFGGRYDYVTLVEYSASKALGANARGVVTTGNSLTFKVDASQAMTTLYQDPGRKPNCPMSFTTEMRGWKRKAMAGRK